MDLLVTIGILVVSVHVLFLLRTLIVESSIEQREFLLGSAPDPKPDGPYEGCFSFYQGSWRGKSFSAESGTGINIFGDKRERRYPFRTVPTKGLRDRALDVLRIDYDCTGNPWWVRRIVDEIVQTAPGRYLGKIHLRVIPGYPFAVGFFRLKKPDPA